MVSLMPIIIGFFLLGFWLITMKVYKRSFKKSLASFVETEIIIISYLLSSIINSLADFMNCLDVGLKSYNSNEVTVKCTDDIYISWRNYLIAPSFLIYLILLPLSGIIYLFRNRKRIFDDKIMRKVKFLIKGYRKEYYYW